ncbi:LysR family transcriptional regulator [Methylovirgula sp. 4M-Z18]|uniref:LysR family transcriptional regulator n=1 Tax=Methylovirgula sp. 4M-Z18 TaxID=2293567 RepID=UPI000E2EE06A|nr:LysR family transcriptional regulator [Methylovirgula sp. 4M-Z18]RFB79753.1 LysR family transcriptional regulator [Methylovirgula sp. 4M-Z18]
MNLEDLRCFVTAAEELHFGRAAQRLDMLPAALGRRIQALEKDLCSDLFVRTTRSVSLSPAGAELLVRATRLLEEADALRHKFRERGRQKASVLRIGAIDTASVGLIPQLLRDFRAAHPAILVELIEEKTTRLLPKLLSGRLDLAFVRPPATRNRQIEFFELFYETAVVAVPVGHALATETAVSIATLANYPLIVPDRRSRPWSHDLTMRLFAHAGLSPDISQVADEKQTIITLVAESMGLAIVPRWTARIGTQGVIYLPITDLDASDLKCLPLAAAWIRGTRDPNRESLVAMISANIVHYARGG